MKAHFALTILKHIRSYKRVSTVLAAFVVVATLSASLMVWRVQAHKDTATETTQGNAPGGFICTPPPPNMVSWYSAEGNANDIIGTNTGTLNGGGYGAGKVGTQAFSFATVGDYVSVPNSTSLQITSALTIDAWINPASTPQLTGSAIVAKDNAGAGAYVLDINTTTLRFYFYDAGGNAFQVTSPGWLTAAKVNVWSHIAATYDSATGVMTLYDNGTAIATNALVPVATQIGVNSHELSIGNKQSSGVTYDRPFAGRIDEVEIFNRALLASEVAAISAADSAGKCHTSTIQFSAPTYNVLETGVNAVIFVTRTGAHDTPASVQYDTVAGGTAQAGASCFLFTDYITTTGTLNFAVNDVSLTFNVPICNDVLPETTETVNLALSNPSGATLGTQATSVLRIFDDETPTAAPSTVSGQVVDGDGQPVEGAAIRMIGAQDRLTITDREGKYQFHEVETGGFYTVIPARANYAFSPGQRSFTQIGQNTDAVFTASATGSSLNPLDTTEYFVRQQYLDFLGREPDEAGFNFWVNNIGVCGADSNCLAAKRTDTSAAFFLSIEFQQTGYLVYRMYQAAYGDMVAAPVPLTLGEFAPEVQRLRQGLIVNAPGWESVLADNQAAFSTHFVARLRFGNAYPRTLTPGEFVDRLFQTAGITPSPEDRAAAIAEFGTSMETNDLSARGRAVRRVAGHSTLRQQESNQAFVLMQYFGYLGRDPNAAPDTNYSGYNFWRNKLDSFNGDFRRAEMVRAFLVAGEYRGRFPR